MAGVENEGGKPRDLPSQANARQPEQAGPRQEGPAENPLAPVLREQQGRQERSHEELVEAFRQAIRRSRQREWEERGERWSPAQIIQSELFHQAQFRFMSEKGRYAEYKQLGEFYYPILKAWDVIAYEHYGRGPENTGSEERRAAEHNLSGYSKRTGQTAIRLSERQRLILEALAEAADIPHQRGQTDIEIPMRFRGFENR